MEKLDVIVVGAGLAGSSAAYVAAKSGLQVALVERGARPGTKTVSGGLLYAHALDRLIPRFWDEDPCPVERAIDRNVLTFLTPHQATSLDFFDARFAEPPFNSFSVLRAKLDAWLAAKAEAAGALPLYGAKVDTLITEGNRVVGVRSDEDELRADVTIIAEGANALTSRRAHRGPDADPRTVGIGVKEVIALPAGEVERRFQLRGRSGTQYTTVGFPSGIEGGGFLYTNRDSLSVGLILNMNSLVRSGRKMYEVLEEYKQHPLLSRLLDGGSLVEYSGCFVSEGGFDQVAPLWGEGYLVAGAAAGFFLNTGFTLRGLDFAIESGRLAGETAVEAAKSHDPSPSFLARYRQALEASFVLRELREFRRYPEVFSSSHWYGPYPEALAHALHRMYRVDGIPRSHAWQVLRESARDLSTFGLARHLVRAARWL
jgi:electron transfer flavoprotein-quinone oxidoreductase